MNPILVKAYASIFPASEQLYAAVSQVLEQWHLPEALSRNGEMLVISHEGVYFPVEQVVEAMRPHLPETSQGKLDYLDLENWRLHRYTVSGRQINYQQASLNKALESCGSEQSWL